MCDYRSRFLYSDWILRVLLSDLGTTPMPSEAKTKILYSCTVTDLIRRHNIGAKRFSRKAACPG
jgi:hypothetical protein